MPSPTADALLARLDKVRAAGAGRWMAACPAHDDKNPSLSIREAEEKILIHCFSGCSASDILAAAGLTLADLFPEPLILNGNKPARPNHYHAAREALRVLHFEVLVVAIGAETLAQGGSLSGEDRARLVQAAGRIRHAAEVCA